MCMFLYGWIYLHIPLYLMSDVGSRVTFDQSLEKTHWLKLIKVEKEGLHSAYSVYSVRLGQMFFTPFHLFFSDRCFYFPHNIKINLINLWFWHILCNMNETWYWKHSFEKLICADVIASHFSYRLLSAKVFDANFLFFPREEPAGIQVHNWW